MRFTICAVGRLRPGPHRELLEDYLARFDKTGRALGLGPATVTEIDPRKGSGIAAETPLLEKALPADALLVALDERGQQMSSPRFAQRLAQWRDDGTGRLAFMIGGADGLAPALRQRARLRLSFGPMVWPHMLARVMLAEQLYRAASILAGTPYHRA